VIVDVQNSGAATVTVSVKNAYSGAVIVDHLAGGATFSTTVSVEGYNGWYDIIVTAKSDATFRQETAGHLETGEASTTDPAIS
jgi:phospholipase C